MHTWYDRISKEAAGETTTVSGGMAIGQGAQMSQSQMQSQLDSVMNQAKGKIDELLKTIADQIKSQSPATQDAQAKEIATGMIMSVIQGGGSSYGAGMLTGLKPGG
jgi:hypothetical protein